jgi:hypothetical protein
VKFEGFLTSGNLFRRNKREEEEEEKSADDIEYLSA